MSINYIENSINIQDLEKLYRNLNCLIENNEKQFSQISDFFKSENKILLLSGFKGTGKSVLLNIVPSLLTQETLILKFYCFETTICDDILLGFFNAFKYYIKKGIITPPKAKVENFTQRINFYFRTINKPIAIILDSFDAIEKENKKDILTFLKHLSTFTNIKIIIAGRKLNEDEFNDIKNTKINLLAFTPKIYEQYLKENEIKQIGAISNELYKLTKGYYNNIKITLNLIKYYKKSLGSFLEDYSKSYCSFSEYIINQLLTLIDPTSIHLFRLLAMIRIPLPDKLIDSLRLYNQEKIDFFVKMSLLEKREHEIYLKDYFRDIIEPKIPNNVAIKIHKACIDLYNIQLPLKPSERDINLSRQTMRNEIEYHSLFIPKKITPIPQIKIEKPQKENLPPREEQPQTEEMPQDKTTQMEKIDFVIDNNDFLNDVANSINKYISSADKYLQMEQTSFRMNISQIVNLARQEEKNFNYKQAILLYQNALLKKDDPTFYMFFPTIYISLANNYKNLSQYYEAIENFALAEEFYYKTNEILKVCEMKYEIAKIYYLMYKTDNAKFMLQDLLKIKNLPNELLIKINMLGAEVSGELKESYEYYHTAISLVNNDIEKSLLSELYYKYAIVLDDLDLPKESAKMYLMCIDIDSRSNNNPYLSKALQNLAQLYDELGASKYAIKYYLESINVDKLNDNNYGLYNSNMHLAEIYAASDDNLAIEYMQNALIYATKTNDSLSIIEANTALGDFYYFRNNIKQAYKYFNKAKIVSYNSMNKEMSDKLENKIKELKSLLKPEDIQEIEDAKN